MENRTIEALEKLIALKDETIKELERQIQLLKNQPPIVIPSTPVQPWVSPAPSYPWQPPYSPQPPYIITSGDTIKIDPNGGSVTGSVVLTGDPLPLGSVQMGSQQNNPNITYTLTNSDGSANIIDLKTCSRV